MTKDERLDLLSELVDTVTAEIVDFEKVKILTAKLEITFSDDPMQLLNNVLKGIHQQEPTHESNV